MRREEGAVGLALCPSLGHYSSFPSQHNRIAIQVVSNPPQKQNSFEFKPSCAEDHKEAFTVSADEIFRNGQILPVYPVQHARTPSPGSGSFTAHHPRSRSEPSLEPYQPHGVEVSSGWEPSRLPKPGKHIRISSEPLPEEFCEWMQKSDDQGTCEWKPFSRSQEQRPLPKYKKVSSIGPPRVAKLRNLVGRLGNPHHRYQNQHHRYHHESNNNEPFVPMHTKVNKTEGGEKVTEETLSQPSTSHDATNPPPQEADGRRSHHQHHHHHRHYHLPNKKNVAGFFSNINKFAHSRIDSF